MVAVGNTKNPGPATHWPNSQGFGPVVSMGVQWKPRDGRDARFAHWDDAFGDALALLKLKRGCIMPKLGKLFVFDVLELRTPSAHNGATLVYIAVEKVSKYALAGTRRCMATPRRT